MPMAAGERDAGGPWMMGRDWSVSGERAGVEKSGWTRRVFGQSASESASQPGERSGCTGCGSFKLGGAAIREA